MDREKGRLRREREIEDLKAVMATKEGRRFIWRLLGQAGIFRPSFVAGSPDTTAFNDGARNQGLNLMAEVMSEAPKQFLTMQQEAMDDEQKRRDEDSADPDRGDSDD
ncbi:MAG: hypothetical protein RQ754_02890 [Desulfuromonadales bacterium]|nr:hypothetical protein [Desulfuromonadales bacterium]